MPDKFFKAIPAVLLVFLIVQTLSAVWWASGVSSRQLMVIERLTALEAKVEKGTDDRYRGSDAAKDFALRDRVLDKHDTKIMTIEKVLIELHARVTTIHNGVD